MSTPWFTHLQVLHQTPRRLRLRYRCRADSPRQAHSISEALQRLPGVERVEVKPQIRSLTLHLQASSVCSASLLASLAALPAQSLGKVPGKAQADTSACPNEVLLSSASLLASRLLPAPLQGGLAVLASLPVLRSGWHELLSQRLGSHVLEGLAVLISLARRDFLAANTTALLLSLGEYLEDDIQRRSDGLLKHLLRPQSDELWVERDGVEQLIDSAEVQVGDCVIAATGSVIAVDGTVLGGEALVNQATMTGESVAVERRRGDRVLAGTLVEEGRLRIYAEQVGEQAAAARIAEFVEQSLEAKSRSQLQASRMADRLVPMVLGLAAGTGLLSRDWRRVAAVLQADYSCALKLATPVAFKAAMYRAGQNGILIKSASALERLAEADTLVFDKTGTLTSGNLRVTDSITFSQQYSSSDLINLAASVEEHYFHPLAFAVVEAARQLEHHQHFNHKEVEFIVAHGVASSIDGKRIVVGSRHFIEDDEGIVVENHRATLDALAAAGKSLLYIGFGGELIGVIALHDSLRANTAATLQRLRQQGIRRILMLTGDHPERAAELAAQLGIDEYHAELLPHDKATILQRLSEQGAKVAFVGDGVNDAPALSGAQVGISMHHGADIARLASDISLLRDDIALVADARDLALATRRLLDSNFKLTVGLNSAILGAAAFGLSSPILTSLLHNGSTIAILLRALSGAGLPRANG